MNTKITIGREFHFDSAHQLDKTGPSKCQNIHGHTYRMEVEIFGEIDSETGMVIEFGEFKKMVTEKVLDLFDHKLLNEVLPALDDEFTNGNHSTTVENLTLIILKILNRELPLHYDVNIKLWEGTGAWARR